MEYPRRSIDFKSWTLVLSTICLLETLSARDLAGQFEPLPPAGCVVDDPRIEVLLLGSYHMSNPGMDQFNLEADDVLKPERQAEISSVVERLTEFRSTKVAVEAPWGDTVAVSRYQRYLAGELEARRSEEEQIGFRLAAAMGHGTVYPIDVRMGLDDSGLGPVIGQNPKFQANMQNMNELGQEAMRTMAGWLSGGTVADMLYNMNDPEMIPHAHRPYIEFFVPIVADTSYAGADMVSTWYQRNIRIFANITRITESTDDRIFIVYGAGHVPILRQLVIDHSGYCVADPLPYLR